MSTSKTSSDYFSSSTSLRLMHRNNDLGMPLVT